MAETNSAPVVDDDKPDESQVTEEDLKKSKEDSQVETSQEADEKLETEDQEESEDTEESEDESTEGSDEETSFVKEFDNIKGDTPEEYAKNLEEAYKNSTAEAIRLKGLVDASPDEEESEDTGPVDPRLLYLDQLLQRDIQTTYEKFSKSYPQTKDPVEYAKFQTEVANLSKYFIDTQKRAAPAEELYSKAAAILEWKPEVLDSKDKLSVALKDSAATTKTTSSTKPKVPSKVTDAQVSVAKAMGGWTNGKSYAEIRKELETVQ